MEEGLVLRELSESTCRRRGWAAARGGLEAACLEDMTLLRQRIRLDWTVYMDWINDVCMVCMYGLVTAGVKHLYRKKGRDIWCKGWWPRVGDPMG